MTDMTIAEATSVLSGVVNNLRAAKRLEEALTVVNSLEQNTKEAEDRKASLEENIKNLRDELEVLNQEIESAQIKKGHQSEKIDAEMRALQNNLKKLKEEGDKQVSELEASFADKTTALVAAHNSDMAELHDEIGAKREELKVVTTVLAGTRAEVSSIRDKLPH